MDLHDLGPRHNYLAQFAPSHYARIIKLEITGANF